MKVKLEEALNQLQNARAAENDQGIANALFVVGVGYMQKERWDAAAGALDEALELCQQLGNFAGQGQVLIRQAELAAQQEKPSQALELLERARAAFAEISDPAGQANALEKRANFLESTGDLAGAARALEEALELALGAKDELSQLLLNQYLAPLYRRLDRADAALEAYRRLGYLSQRLGEPQREALALMGVGTLLLQAGNQAEGLQALDKAREMYAELGQAKLAAQVKQEMDRLAG